MFGSLKNRCIFASVINQNNKTMTTENNKLIAEFMGLSIKEGVSYYTDVNDMFPMGIEVDKPYLPYDKSWDWLMPVVEKIEEVFIDDSNLIIKEHRYEFDMKYTQCEIYDHVRDCVVASGDMGSKILSTYQSVVEFIKEYNNN